MSVQVYLPAIGFEVDLYPTGHDGMTAIEQAAVYFIAAKGQNATLDTLTEFTGLGDHATFDLMLGMWRHGWLGVDPRRGKITLNDVLRQHAREGTLDRMGTTEPPTRVQLIYDLVTGQVAPVDHPEMLRNSGRAERTYPKGARTDEERGLTGGERFEMPLDGYLNASVNALEEAIRQHKFVREKVDPDRMMSFRVLDPARPARNGDVKYYDVWFDVHTMDADAGTRTLVLEVNDTRPVRRLLGKALAPAIALAAARDPNLDAYLRSDAVRTHPGMLVEKDPILRFLDKIREDERAGTRALRGEAATGALWWVARRALLRKTAARALEFAPLSGVPAVLSGLQELLAARPKSVIVASTEADIDAIDAATSSKSPAASNPALIRWLGDSAARITLQLPLGERRQKETDQAERVLASMFGDRVRIARPSQDGQHTHSAIAAADGATFLLTNAPLLSGGATQGLKLRFEASIAEDGKSAAWTASDAWRALRRDIGGWKGDEGNAERRNAVQRVSQETFPLEIKLAVDLFDADFAIYRDSIDEDDFYSRIPVSLDQGGSKADVKQDALRRAERRGFAERLVQWAYCHSEAVEICIDSEIIAATIAIIELAPVEVRLALGLMDQWDFRPAEGLLDALRARDARAPGTVDILLPAADRDANAVDRLSAVLQQNCPSFKIFEATFEGRHRPFSFVVSPDMALVASRGLATRIVNIGRFRRGTAFGVSVAGRKQVAAVIAALRTVADLSAYAAIGRGATTEPFADMAQTSVLARDWQGRENRIDIRDMRERLRAEPGLPWRPDDPSADYVDDRLRNALLHAAAQLESADDRFLGARAHFVRSWEEPPDLFAAAACPSVVDREMDDPTLRAMALSAAAGVRLEVEIPDTVAYGEATDGWRDRFRALGALILAQCAEPDLAAGLQALSDPEGDALDRLVIALVRFRARAPDRLLAMTRRRIRRNAPPLETSWKSLSDHLYRRLRVDTLPLSFRYHLFEEKEGKASLTSRLRGILRRHPSPVTARNELEQLLRPVIDFDELSDPAQARRAAADIYHDEHETWYRNQSEHDRVYGASATQFRSAIEKTLDHLSDISAALAAFAPLAGSEAEVLRCARTWTDETGRDGGRGGVAWAALAVALGAGGGSWRRVPWRIPSLLLPGAAATAETCLERLLYGYFPSTPEGLQSALDELFKRSLWSEIAALLRILPSLTPVELRVGIASAARAEIRKWIDQTIKAQAAELSALIARRSLNDLTSSAFGRRRAKVEEWLKQLRSRSMTIESDWPPAEIADALHACGAELAALEQEYNAAFAEAAARLRADLESTHVAPSVRPLVAAQIGKDRLDIARWLMTRQIAPAGPQPKAYHSRLAKTFRRMMKKPERGQLIEQLQVLGMEPDAVAFVQELMTLDSDAPHPLSEPKARRLFGETARLFGAELGATEIKRTSGGWLATIADPTLSSLAPHLWSPEVGALPIRLLDHLKDSPGEVAAGDEVQPHEASAAVSPGLTIMLWGSAPMGPDCLAKDDLLSVLHLGKKARVAAICGRLMGRMRKLEDWWPTRLRPDGLGERDTQKRYTLERLLGRPWSDLAADASDGVGGVVREIAARLGLPLDNREEGDDDLAAGPVPVTEIIEFFAGGNLLNAVDLLVHATPSRRRLTDRRGGQQPQVALRIEQILSLTPHQPLGATLLRRIATADGGPDHALLSEMVEAMTLVSEKGPTIGRAELEHQFTDLLLGLCPDPAVGWAGLALQAGLIKEVGEGGDLLAWRHQDGIMSLLKLMNIRTA